MPNKLIVLSLRELALPHHLEPSLGHQVLQAIALLETLPHSLPIPLLALTCSPLDVLGLAPPAVVHKLMDLTCALIGPLSKPAWPSPRVFQPPPFWLPLSVLGLHLALATPVLELPLPIPPSALEELLKMLASTMRLVPLLP